MRYLRLFVEKSKTLNLKGTESQIFKSKFEIWDEIIPTDYTKIPTSFSKKRIHVEGSENISRSGSIDSLSSLTPNSSRITHILPNNNQLRSTSMAPMHRHKTTNVSSFNRSTVDEPLKTDLVALFMNRYVQIGEDEGLSMMEEINDYLESMQCFVFENKKFTRLPEREFGQFYSEDSYLFVCRYYKEKESEEDKNTNKEDDQNDEESGEPSLESRFYFWQGRNASNMGWLTFSFTLKIKSKNIEIIKLNQQQESSQFLAHFKRKFIVHKGKRKSKISTNPNAMDKAVNKYETKMYHLRKNPHSAICTRCIQLDTAKAENLCSSFCYIVCVPFENSDGSNATKGIAYVWIGSNSNPDEARLAEEIAEYMYEV